MKKSIFLLLSIVLLSGCQNKKFKTEIALNLYSLDVPIHMKNAPNLNPDASLQFQNPGKELYVIVIVENKQLVNNILYSGEEFSDDLNGYSKLIRKGMEESMGYNPNFSSIKNEQKNEFNINTFNISGKIDGIKIYYECANIESENYYYQIITWTDFEKKAQNITEMKLMINSFKEINKTATLVTEPENNKPVKNRK